MVGTKIQLDKAQREKIKKLYADGISMFALAERFGVCRSVIYDTVKRKKETQ